jgi:hypothetical protein
MTEERLNDLTDLATNPQLTTVTIPSNELLELLRAYHYHKRVLPLHQKINEACKELGF